MMIESDDFELDECGFSFEHGCRLAATEFCDWECPLHYIYVLWLETDEENQES